MQVVHVPGAVASHQKIVAGEISFVNYQDKGGPFRSRVLFSCYAFSFVQNGQKKIYRAGNARRSPPGTECSYPRVIRSSQSTAIRRNRIAVLLFFFQHISAKRLSRPTIGNYPALLTGHLTSISQPTGISMNISGALRT